MGEFTIVIQVKNGQVVRVESKNVEEVVKVVYTDDADNVQREKTFEWPFIQPDKFGKELYAGDGDEEEECCCEECDNKCGNCGQ